MSSYCDYLMDQIAGKEDTFQYIDIGIPAFQLEDGRITRESADA